MKPIRISVIGTGHAGADFHLPGLSTFDDVELSICDINATSLHAAGDQFGIPAGKRYTDYREMLRREDPAAVLVLMAQYPTYIETEQSEIVRSTGSRDAYFTIVKAVLDQKRHVLVEKPLAMTPEEALPLVQAAEKAGVIAMVSENRRFNPLLQYCRTKVLKRGPILNVACHFYKCEPPRRQVQTKDGALHWIVDDVDWLTGDMIHALYLMRYLGGGEIVDFSSSMADIAGDQVPTAFFALARFASGATGLFSSNVRVGARRELWEIHGPGISAYIETVPDGADCRNMKASLYTGNDHQNPEVVFDHEVAGGGDYQKCSGFTGADRYFIDCVRENKQPHCSFADAYETLCCCKTILNGKRMTVT